MDARGLVALVLTVHAPAALAAGLSGLLLALTALLGLRRLPLPKRAWLAVLAFAAVCFPSYLILAYLAGVTPLSTEVIGVGAGPFSRD